MKVIFKLSFIRTEMGPFSRRYDSSVLDGLVAAKKQTPILFVCFGIAQAVQCWT